MREFKKWLKRPISLMLLALVVVAIPFMNCNDDSPGFSIPETVSINDLVTVSGEVDGKIPFQTNLVVTCDNSDEKIKGLNDPDKIDSFDLRFTEEFYQGKATTEILKMTETEKDSKIYKSSKDVRLELGEIGDRLSDDGIILIISPENDVIELSFYDEIGFATEGTDGSDYVHYFSKDFKVIIGDNGTISITQNANVGESLSITVTDSDLNTDESVAETVDVTVTSDKGETEIVTLTETEVNSGVFEGSLATTAGSTQGTDNDQSLVVSKNTVVTATYVDEYSYSGEQNTLTAQSTFSAAAEVAPTVTTGTLQSKTTSSIVIQDNSVVEGDPVSTEYGMAYRANATGDYTYVSSSGDKAGYSVEITGLTAATSYEIAAYALQNGKYILGITSSFTTEEEVASTFEFIGGSASGAVESCGDEQVDITFSTNVAWSASATGETLAGFISSSGSAGNSETASVLITGSVIGDLVVAFKKDGTEEVLGTYTITPGTGCDGGGGPGGGELPIPE